MRCAVSVRKKSAMCLKKLMICFIVCHRCRYLQSLDVVKPICVCEHSCREPWPRAETVQQWSWDTPWIRTRHTSCLL